MKLESIAKRIRRLSVELEAAALDLQEWRSEYQDDEWAARLKALGSAVDVARDNLVNAAVECAIEYRDQS